MSSAPSLSTCFLDHLRFSKIWLTAEFLKGFNSPSETQRVELSVQLEASFQEKASLLYINPFKCSIKALDEETVKLGKLVHAPDNLEDLSKTYTRSHEGESQFNKINTGKFYLRHNLNPSCCSLNPIPLGLIYICKKLSHPHNERC